MSTTAIATVRDGPVGQQSVTQAAEPALPLAEAPVIPQQRYPDIGKALQAAQARCKAASKESTNTFHHYKYASAEAIITEAKAALESTGLSVLPHPPKLLVIGNGQQATYGLRRQVILLHSSGEWVPLEPIEWPVIPERGRPLDKAFAGAITTSLAYFLRDLLMMPRVDPADNMDDDSRDRAAEPEPAKPAPPPPKQAAPKPQSPAEPKKAAAPPGNTRPENGAQLWRRLNEYDAKKGYGGRFVANVVKQGIEQHGYPADVSAWSPEAIAFACDPDLRKQIEAALALAAVKQAPNEPPPAEQKPARGTWGGGDAPAKPAPRREKPKTGEELRSWLLAEDEDGAKAGHWLPAKLHAHVRAVADAEDVPPPQDMAEWTENIVRAAVEIAEDFRRRATTPLRDEQEEAVVGFMKANNKTMKGMAAWLREQTGVPVAGELVSGLRQVHYEKLRPLLAKAQTAA